MTTLTKGVIAQLVSKVTDFDTPPTVQVVSLKPTQQKNGTTRYKITISDGIYTMSAYAGSVLNSDFEQGLCKTNSIIKLNEVTVNSQGTKHIVFILKLETVKLNVDSVIGNPQPYGGSSQGEQQQESKQTKPLIPVKQQSKEEVVHQNEYRGRLNSGTSSSSGNKKKQNYSNDDTLSVQPISTLNPYQPNWCIQARVTKKSDVKEWKKPNNSGKLFSVDLIDEDGEIRAVMFNNAVDQFYDIFQEGMVFIISKGNLKNANRQFSSVNNDYEITLDEQSIIKPVKDDSNIPHVKFSCLSIAEVKDVPENQIVDVLVVVQTVGQLQELVAKSTNKPFKKKSLTVCDDSGVKCELTLWGQHSENSDIQEGEIVLFKGVKKSNFGGVSLGTTMQTSIIINPKIDEAHSLRGWYNKNANDSIQSLTVKQSSTAQETYTIAAIKDEDKGKGEKADFLKVQGTITYVKLSDTGLWYDSCPECNKKMTPQTHGYRCDNCNQDRETCVKKYIVSVIISDHTGNKWVSGFGDAGTTIFGMSADELSELKDSNPEEYQAVCTEANFKEYTFILRIKEEFGKQGESYVKAQIQKIWPMDYVKGSKALLREIAKYQ
eukprot:gene7781-12255_t